jgi:hypothetical protein
MACILTPEERAIYQARLTEAEAALHSANIGGQVREFHDQNGERVVYSSSNRAGLIGYINYLRSVLGLPPMCGLVARPAGVFL